MKPRKHVSFSELQTWGRCEHLWSVTYCKGVRAEAYSIHLDFGSALHLAIEHYKAADPTQIVDNPVELFKDKFTELFELNSESYPVQKGLKAKFKQFLEIGERLLWAVDFVPQLRDAVVIANEFALYEPIEGLDINFKGFIDIVLICKDILGTESIFVCDFKTTAWGWDLQKVQDAATLQQVLVYKFFLARRMDLKLSDIKCAFILMKKNLTDEKPIEFLTVDSSVSALKGALTSLYRDVKKMRAGLYSKNRESCVAYGELCPLFDTEHCGIEDLSEDKLTQIRSSKKV